MFGFPPVQQQGVVDASDHVSAIDFVNRVNWWFETWNVDAMVNAFLPEGVAFHFHGTIEGQVAMRRFFEDDYPYLVPGVSRHATNHIVDPDGDGVEVRYHNLLIRHARPAGTPQVAATGLVHSGLGLPALWIYSPMRDRLRRVDGQWKIFERYIGNSVLNADHDPSDTERAGIAAFLPIWLPESRHD